MEVGEKGKLLVPVILFRLFIDEFGFVSVFTQINEWSEMNKRSHTIAEYLSVQVMRKMSRRFA